MIFSINFMVVNLKYNQIYVKHFEKRIATNANLSARFDTRIEYFINNPSHPLLRNHALTGTKKGLRAFSVTGDIRIIYQRIDEDTVELLDIGTHNQVYG